MKTPTLPDTQAAVAQAAAAVDEITIDSMATGGEGVGRGPDGRVVFVTGAAPGDRVAIRVTERKKHFSRAEVARVIEASPERVEPACPLFARGECGGCQWQHLSLLAQHRAKLDIIKRELRAPIQAGMELLPLSGPVPEYRWRRRSRVHFARPRGASAAAVGFFAPRSHHLVDVAACPQMDAAVADAYGVIRTELAAHLGSSGEIEILAGHTGQVHVAITGFCSPKHPPRLVGKGGASGTIAGVTLHPPRPLQKADRRSTDRAPEPEAGRPGKRTPIHWGARTIELEPGFLGRADHFAQASLAGNQALLKAVEHAAGLLEGKEVVEFHAGSGNLTRVFARAGARVLATDARPVPWRKDLVVGPADKVAAELVQEGRKFAVAVLDPPRTGAAELMGPLLALAPERIVYVSCDPATLARDLGTLQQGGYRAESAQPLDLMPQTAHVEVVVCLHRS